jgi:hypothetical protein
MKLRICFTIPNGMNLDDTIAFKCYQGLPKTSINISYIVAQGASIGKNRNACILNGRSEYKKQSNLEFDYYLFVDYDISFNFEHIIMLLKSNKLIITGSYPDKSGNDKIYAGQWNIPGLIGTNGLYSSTGLSKIDWCGSGFLMIHKSILEEVLYPWFRSYVLDLNQMATVTSEDIGFCLYLGQLKKEIWCNYDCKLIHMKDGCLK